MKSYFKVAKVGDKVVNSNPRIWKKNIRRARAGEKHDGVVVAVDRANPKNVKLDIEVIRGDGWRE